MSATFYAQLLREWRWTDIRDALIEAIDDLRVAHVANQTQALDDVFDGIHVAAFFPSDEPNLIEARLYMGQVMNLLPSGRFYPPWSPIESGIRDRDHRWWAALERCADKFGLSVENGEDDPTDVFIAMYVDRHPYGADGSLEISQAEEDAMIEEQDSIMREAREAR